VLPCSWFIAFENEWPTWTTRNYCSSIYRHGTQPKQKYNYDPDIYTFVLKQTLRINQSFHYWFGFLCDLRDHIKPKIWFLSKPLYSLRSSLCCSSFGIWCCIMSAKMNQNNFVYSEDLWQRRRPPTVRVSIHVWKFWKIFSFPLNAHENWMIP
jgi:hypothetical protein